MDDLRVMALRVAKQALEMAGEPELVAKYSEDQARADNGQFGSGSTTSGPNGKLSTGHLTAEEGQRIASNSMASARATTKAEKDSLKQERESIFHGAAARTGTTYVTKSVAPDGWSWAEVPEGVDVGCDVIKAVEEQRFTLGLAYPALSPDVAKAMDGHRDFASAELVEKAAWGYMADHREVGLIHFTPDSAAGTVVESYVYRGPDWCCKAVDGSEQMILAGDWLLGTVWTPPAWAAIKSGQVDGLSVVGSARRRKPSAEALASLRR